LFVFWYMHIRPELKQIQRVYQTPFSGAETYDSDTPTLWRKPVSTINTSSASYQAGLSPYEINTKAYGPVVASAIGVVDGASEAASAVYNFSAESLQKLSDSISGGVDSVTSTFSDAATAVSNGVESVVSTVSDAASEGLQAVEDLGSSVTSTASEVTSAVTDALSSATSTVTDAVSSAASTVSDAASSVGSSISDTASSIAAYVTLGTLGTKSLLDTKA